jgi:ubiquinone/menaquinone biosynthesis C-methylase UbiE
MKKYIFLTISNLFIFLILPITRLISKKIYDKYVLPKILSFTCNTKPINYQRKKIIPSATGFVVELGVGAGANFRYYKPEKILKVIAIDPSSELNILAREEAKKYNIEIQILNQSAENIPFEDNSIDTVVSTYTLCSIPNPDQTMREVYRVLKPNGIFLFSEHGRSPDRFTVFIQDQVEFFYPFISGGCHCNRDIKKVISNSNLEFQSLDTTYLPGTQKFLGFNYWGTAIKL